MKLKFFTFILILSFHTNCFGQRGDGSGNGQKKRSHQERNVDKKASSNIKDLGDEYASKAQKKMKVAEYDLAIQLNKKALAWYIKDVGEEHEKTAKIYFKLGNIYRKIGAYDRAIKYHEKALGIRKRVLGKSHPEVARSYNNLGAVYEYKADYDQLIAYNELALDIQDQKLDKSHPDRAKTHDHLGQGHYQKGYYEKALMHYEKMLAIRENTYGKNHQYVARAYNSIGEVNYTKGNYETALEKHQMALNIFVKIHGKDHPDLADTYNNLGLVYDKKGNYEQAMEYYQQALNIRKKVVGEKHIDIAEIYSNLGTVELAKQDYNKALNYYERAFQIRKDILGRKHNLVATSYNNLGSIYFLRKQYEAAQKYHKNALRIQESILGQNHNAVAATYFKMAQVEQAIGQQKQAIDYLNQSLPIYKKSFGNKHPDIAAVYQAIGRSKLQNERLEETLSYVQKALIANSRNFETTDWQQNPRLEDGIFSNQEQILALSLKSEVLVKMGELEFAHETYLLIIELLDQIRTSYLSDKDKVELLANSLNIYEAHIALAYDLYQQTKDYHYIENAFQAAEKSRSITLLENLQSNYAKSYADIPEELLKREYDFQTSIAIYEQKVFEAQFEQQNIDSSLITHWNNRLFELRRELADLENQMANDFPDYHRLKYSSEVVSIKSVQQNILKPENTLLEYFEGEKHLYAIVISVNDYQFYQIKKDFDLKKLVQNLQENTYNYHLSALHSDRLYEQYADSLVQVAHQLYEYIFKPITQGLSLTKELIIVPDGVLGYLPFELLISELPKASFLFGKHSYLIQDYQISYSYSTTLLQEMQQKKHPKTEGDFLAFAPTFESKVLFADASRPTEVVRRQLGALLYNVVEVQNLQRLIGGEVLLREEATEENFYNTANKYKIIHLATHGKANDRVGDYAYLAFSEIKDSIENEILYNRDLYNLRLNAEMVVLSACETGIGELQRGEGIISLARGFSYAGAKSIITTLWSVNDEKTKELMERFYHQIKAGKTKDAALRQAKLDFMAQYAHEAHPFYWAAFIPVGDMAAIELENNHWKWWLGGILFLSVLLIYWWRR